MAFAIRSSAFAEGSTIPKKYTLDGDNVSPPLEWSDPPRGTRAFALVCEDPDAPSGTFRHWAVCNIAADRNGVSEGIGREAEESWRVARNDFGNAGYDGPRPPQGHGLHHYHFRLLALDTDKVEIPADKGVDEFWKVVQPHVLAQTETVGTYQR